MKEEISGCRQCPSSKGHPARSRVIPVKAQASFEFMVVLTALLMLFIIVFVITSGGRSNLLQAQDNSAASRNSYSVASAINFVYLAGDGASYNYTSRNAPPEMNTTITGYTVTTQWMGAWISAPLLDGRVNESSMGTGSFVITNNGGEIDISQ
jgi:uncharacterized protein (UPF0333 family)